MTLSCIIPIIIIFTNQGDRTKWGMRVQNTKKGKNFCRRVKVGLFDVCRKVLKRIYDVYRKG